MKGVGLIRRTTENNGMHLQEKYIEYKYKIDCLNKKDNITNISNIIERSEGRHRNPWKINPE